MPFQKGQSGNPAKVFKKGQSGNPSGRPKGAMSQAEWRRRNTERLQALLTEQDIDGALLRWWSRFVAGNASALWIKDQVFEAPPKAPDAEPPPEDKVTEIAIKRFEKKTSGDGDAGGD